MSADTTFFTEHSIESAPPAARRFMTATRDHLGYLPAGMARRAASPQLVDGFLRLSAIFENTTLEPMAREVVVMTMATRNRCLICVAMHTARLTALGADPGLIEALRNPESGDPDRAEPLPDECLDAVRVFALRVLDTAGDVGDQALQDFLAAGYTTQNALEVVLGIGTYTMSTLANRLTRAPVDDQLAAYAWALSSADVEDDETHGHADTGDDPEADHDGGLGPAGQLEVVLQRGHPEHPLAGQLERPHLDHHRQGDEHEQAAEQEEQQLGLGGDGQPGERAAEGQRAGVAHEDLGGWRVPPEEAGAGAHHGGGHDGQVLRVADGIARLGEEDRAVVPQLPDPDNHVRRERQDGRAGGQAVQPVGEVHPVRGLGHHENDPDHEEHRPDGEAEVGVEGQVGGRRGEVVPVREPDREQREHPAHHGLPGQLGPAAQAQAALHVQLDEVVREPDQAQAGHQEQHEQPGRGHGVAGDEVADQVPGQRRDDDHRAAHGRRAPLGQVPGRADGPDLLAVAAPAERLDRQRGAEQRDEQRHGRGQQDGLHWPASLSRAAATPSRCAARDAFTSTTSEGLSRFASTSRAAAPSVTASASPVQDRTRRAPSSSGLGSSPTAMSPARPVSPTRAAYSPMSSWLAREVPPSSAM